MSALVEYLKLIPKGLPHIDKLLEGVINEVKMELGTIPQEELDIIVGRRLICKTCPFMSANAVKLGIYETDRTDEHCKHCGCPTSTRTASLESNCGIEEYNKLNKDNPLLLKWTKFEKNAKK